METCYLKRLNYYSNCRTCLGGDENPCHNTRFDVEEELQHIHRLFAERLETMEDEEDTLEQQFDFKNFGMGFK